MESGGSEKKQKVCKNLNKECAKMLRGRAVWSTVGTGGQVHYWLATARWRVSRLEWGCMGWRRVGGRGACGVEGGATQ